jgi:Sulfatase
MTEASEPRAAAARYFARVAPYAAPALILLAIVVPFLNFYGYSLVLPESLMLIGVAATFGVAIGAVSRLRRTLAPPLIALTLFAYIFCRQDVTDMFVAESNRIGGATGHPFVVLAAVGLMLFGIICLICMLLRRHLDTIVIAVFGTMVVASVALPSGVPAMAFKAGESSAELKDLPPVIHIVLDEHIGLAGLPPDFEASQEARQIVAATYKDFALYSHAYSRYDETKYSLASLVNGDRGPNVVHLLGEQPYSAVMKQNAWFDTLKTEGYSVRVYQSAWLDMCSESSAVDSCFTATPFSLDAVQRSSLSTTQRLRALVRKLLIGREALQVAPMISQELLARFRADVADRSRGRAFYVHLIFPHYGYLYGRDCALLDPLHWEKEDFGDDDIYTREERAGLYPRYLNQLICSAHTMESLFSELKSLGIYDEATIIIHGDHGSRLAAWRYVSSKPERFSERDKIDDYSTLLAIKAPGIAPGIYDEPVALQQIFAQTFLGGAGAASPRPGEVFVRKSEDSDSFSSLDFAWPDAPAPVANTTLPRLIGATGG